MPTTIDELTEVLRQFHETYDSSMTLLVNADLDDGLAAVFNHANVGLTRQMIGFQQTAPNSGEVVCAMASDGYFDHMTYLRELYAEGIISSDFLSISKENGNFESSYYTGVCGVCRTAARWPIPAMRKMRRIPTGQGSAHADAHQ